jgi:hypothetical protein
MDASNWKPMIETAMGQRPPPVTAVTYRNVKWATFSSPVLLGCDDGKDYVVKGKQGKEARRAMVNEWIAGTLGGLLEAPVKEISLVEVPADLIDAQRNDLGHLSAGVSFGSVYVPNCSPRAWLQHQDVAENKPRFARLAVLYGWIQSNDHQLIYEQSNPQLVWSVDHGHFFAGPSWTVASLASSGPATTCAEIVNGCQVAPEQLSEVKSNLQAITPEKIAWVVAGPHDTWEITIDERIAMAQYLERRKGELIAVLP